MKKIIIISVIAIIFCLGGTLWLIGKSNFLLSISKVELSDSWSGENNSNTLIQKVSFPKYSQNESRIPAITFEQYKTITPENYRLPGNIYYTTAALTPIKALIAKTHQGNYS